MRLGRKLGILLFLVYTTFFVVYAQQPSAPSDISAAHAYFPVLTSLPPVAQANTAIVGNPGNGTYRYWLVANYTFGQAPISHMFKVGNGPNVLTGSNYITVTPTYPLGATVDLLRTTSDAPPSGTGNYAVSTGRTSGSISDTGGALSSYTVAPISTVPYGLCLSNQVTGAAAAHLLLDMGPPDNCNTLVVDLSEATGGGTITGATPNGGLVVSGTTLGLLTTCTASQVLEWNGTAWACATVSGTISGSGTGGYLPEWTGTGASTALGNSPIRDTGLLTSTESIEVSFSGTNTYGLYSLIAPSFCGNGVGITITSQPTCWGTGGDNTVVALSGVSAGGYFFNSSQHTGGGNAIAEGLFAEGADTSAVSQSYLQILGVVGIGTLGGGETVPIVDGVQGVGVVGGTAGTATILAGVVGQVQSSNAFTAQPLTAAFYAASPTLSNDGAAHNYGLYIADQTTGGAANPDPWGIYEAGTAKNQFGGNVTIASPGTLTLSAMTGTNCLEEVSGVVTAFSGPCAASGGSGTVNNALQYSAPYYSAAGTTNILSGLAPPTTNGLWFQTWNVSASAAVAPVFSQAGVGARAVVGTASTDTILYSDATSRVDYQTSVAVAVSLPTPTTLSNPSFGVRLSNDTTGTGAGTAVTVTPAGSLNINGAATLVIPEKTSCLITADASGGFWNADCSPTILFVSGAAPTTDGSLGFDFTTHALLSGSNGTAFAEAVAASGAGNTATTCTNQVITAISAIAVPTCTAITASFLPGAPGGTVLGNNGSTTAPPGYESSVVLGIPGTTAGAIALASSTAGGSFHIITPASSATPNLTLPTSGGVFTNSVAGDGTVLNSTGCTTSAAGLCTLALVSTPTGTGTVLVLSVSPTLTTPNLGVAAATSLALNGAAAMTTVGWNNTATAHDIGLYEGAGTAQNLLNCGAGTILQGASSADPTCTATPTHGVQNTTQGLLTLAGGSSGNPGQLILDIAGASAFGSTIQPGVNTAATVFTLPIGTGAAETLVAAAAALTNTGICLGQAGGYIACSASGIASSSGSIFSKYGGIATVNNGVPSELGTVDASLSAAVTATTLYTPAATGRFRISASLIITTAATTSSILGGTTGVVITYTDGTSSVAQSVTCYAVNQSAAIITIGTGNTGNTTTSQYNCIPMYIYAKTGVAIQYAIGYTSVGGTAMVYEAHLLAESM
jgi:hypothetical protein